MLVKSLTCERCLSSHSRLKKVLKQAGAVHISIENLSHAITKSKTISTLLLSVKMNGTQRGTLVKSMENTLCIAICQKALARLK